MKQEAKQPFEIKRISNQNSPDIFRTTKRAFCNLCKKPVQLIDFEIASDYLQKTIAELIKLAAKHELHRIHNSKATVMICSNSLFRHFENKQTCSLNPSLIALKSLGTNNDIPIISSFTP